MNIKNKLNKNIYLDNDLVLFANELADLSEKIIHKYFRSDALQDFEKDDASPLTIADTEVEQALRNLIEQRYPEHGIHGEEFGETSGNSPYKWYIDPIDGTSSFVCGKPIFTTLIALTYEQKPIFGIINQPILKERWQGGDAFQTNLNGSNISTRQIAQLADAIFCTTSPYLFNEQQLKKFESIKAQTKYQKYGGVFFGGDSYSYGLLASGHVDIILEAGLKAHDFLALAPVVSSAGGIISDWQGNPLEEYSNGEVLACGSKEIHQQVLELLR